jgi:UDP-N-acetylglucosamine transferase subunit ALG13
VSILIFVTVGSRNYPFDRLFIKLDELFEKGVIKDQLFAQVGTSTYKPKHYMYKDFVSQKEFLSLINQSDIVVSHGASGSIMKALNAGKKVIAVTRLKKYGEHINDHQIQNNEAFGLNKYVVPVFELDDLEVAFKCIENGTAELIPWQNKDPMAIINLIDDFVKKNWNKCK